MSSKVKRIVFDLETGGLDCKKNPITEICMYATDEKWNLVDKFIAVVKPYDDDLVYEDKAIAVQQLSMEEIEKGESANLVAVKIIAFLKKHSEGRTNRGCPILVGHNVPFDISFIKQFLFTQLKKNLSELVQSNNNEILYFDTQLLARGFWSPTWKSGESSSISLSNCCKKVGIELVDAHGAENDVDATRKLAKYFFSLINQSVGEVEKKDKKSRNFFNF